LNTWRSALSLLPKPHAQYEESVWLYACIGDAQADLGNPQDALRSYEAAYEGPEGHLNPYVLLQMGKILADTGRWELARDRLMRAYMLEGKDIFDGGDQPYLDRLREDEEIVL
jgi:tetratricopeptide (TPR) repeat protein